MSIFDQLKPLEDDDEPEPRYRGNTGHVVVARGEGDRACYLDIESCFGALLSFVREDGIHDPEDAGLLPPDEGIWRARATVWTSRSYEGEHDIGFNVIGEWEKLASPPAKKARRKTRPLGSTTEPGMKA